MSLFSAPLVCIFGNETSQILSRGAEFLAPIEEANCKDVRKASSLPGELLCLEDVIENVIML